MFRLPDPPYEPPETRDWSIQDPQLITLFGGAPSLAGVAVNPRSALGLSAVYRSVSLISGSIASLPLRTVITGADGVTQRTNSWLDDPAGPDGMTGFEWVEFLMVSLLLHGNAYFLRTIGGAGQLLGLQPLPPQCVGVELKDGRKLYRVQLDNGQSRQLTDREIVHIPGISLDGIVGISPITIAKNILGAAIGRRTKRRTALRKRPAVLSHRHPRGHAHRRGSGSDQGITVAQGRRRSPRRRNQCDKPAIESQRRGRLTPKRPSSSRAVRSPLMRSRDGSASRHTCWARRRSKPHSARDSSEQNRGYAKYTLEPWTRRIEARLTRLLPPDRKAEFDFRSLISPDPETEIRLLLDQVAGGLLSRDEARAILNRAPLPEAETPPQVTAA